MTQWILGVAAICVGGAMVAFRRRFGHFVLEQQARAWGFKFDQQAVFVAMTVATVVGAGFFVIGWLALLGIIQFR